MNPSRFLENIGKSKSTLKAHKLQYAQLNDFLTGYTENYRRVLPPDYSKTLYIYSKDTGNFWLNL